MSGWRPYSLANTNGTIPWGRAAYRKTENIRCQIINIRKKIINR
jgi:hypothetical protein